MKSLEPNKILGAFVLASLIAVVTGHVANAVYSPIKQPEKRGFQIEVADATPAASGTTAQAETIPDVLPLLAAADVNAGKELSKKYAMCHTFNKGEANKVGPNLWNVVGSLKGTHVPGFAYSTALSDKGKAGEKWDYKELASFLYAPQKAVKGTKMAFAGIKKPEELASVVAYLRTLNDNPPALP